MARGEIKFPREDPNDTVRGLPFTENGFAHQTRNCIAAGNVVAKVRNRPL